MKHLIYAKLNVDDRAYEWQEVASFDTREEAVAICERLTTEQNASATSQRVCNRTPIVHHTYQVVEGCY